MATRWREEEEEGDDEYDEDEYENEYYEEEEEEEENGEGAYAEGEDEAGGATPADVILMRRSTGGRRSLQHSRAGSKVKEGRATRFARSAANAWNGTKSWFLGPLFIGMALGVGVSLGRSLFLASMQRATRLLLGPVGSARFGLPA